MIRVPVELGVRRYEVVVGPGARFELGKLIAEKAPGAARAALVTQGALTDQPWFSDLDPGLPFAVHRVPEGEGAKSLAVLEELCRAWARQGLSRHDVVVAVGGGVVTDLAGFAAAAYHRGTPYVNVATTLLGQVDAAIGGKTAVNREEGKNLVGACWQPIGVIADTEVLATLPGGEMACGRGEMAKYAFLGGDGTALLERPLEEQVAACAAIKARIVAADEREGDQRMLLNYGHTLAHAIEAASFDHPGAPRHGEAVAVGLVFAALLARRLGRIDDERVALHRRVVRGFGLSERVPPGLGAEELLAYMARDKKAHHDLTFVLDGPQGPAVVRHVEPAAVLATLAEMDRADDTADEAGEGRPGS